MLGTDAQDKGRDLTCLVGEARYNMNFETRDEDVLWIGEHGPYRHHIG